MRGWKRREWSVGKRRVLDKQATAASVEQDGEKTNGDMGRLKRGWETKRRGGVVRIKQKVCDAGGTRDEGGRNCKSWYWQWNATWSAKATASWHKIASTSLLGIGDQVSGLEPDIRAVS